MLGHTLDCGHSAAIHRRSDPQQATRVLHALYDDVGREGNRAKNLESYWFCLWSLPAGGHGCRSQKKVRAELILSKLQWTLGANKSCRGTLGLFYNMALFIVKY